MQDWLAAFALTLAGSAHCAGMCGGFVLAAAADRSGLRLVMDHLLLQLGKASSYAFLGALAGAIGATLLQGRGFVWSTRVLALLAGAALVGAGLALLGYGSGGDRLAALLAPLYASSLGRLLRTRPPGASLVAGLVMGFLPCPLVYAGLAAAAATGSPLRGAVVLAGVALGTLPALLLVAALGRAGSPLLRQRLAQAAAVLLIATGLVTAWRGLGAPHDHGAHAPAAVPSSGHAHHH